MKYKANYLPTQAKAGDKYIIKFFTWFPFEINREIRWLETVYVEYKADIESPYFEGYFYWKPIRFVTKENYDEN